MTPTPSQAAAALAAAGYAAVMDARTSPLTDDVLAVSHDDALRALQALAMLAGTALAQLPDHARLALLAAYSEVPDERR